MLAAQRLKLIDLLHSFYCVVHSFFNIKRKKKRKRFISEEDVENGIRWFFPEYRTVCSADTYERPHFVCTSIVHRILADNSRFQCHVKFPKTNNMPVVMRMRNLKNFPFYWSLSVTHGSHVYMKISPNENPLHIYVRGPLLDMRMQRFSLGKTVLEIGRAFCRASFRRYILNSFWNKRASTAWTKIERN